MLFGQVIFWSWIVTDSVEDGRGLMRETTTFSCLVLLMPICDFTSFANSCVPGYSKDEAPY